MSKPSVGFIGLGRMGNPMASRLIEAGYEVTVHDAVESSVAALTAKGAKRAGSPAEVASQAEIVFASLPTPDIVQAVALGQNGVVHGSRVRIFVDLSTTGPRVAAAIAAGFQAAGKVVAVDCPVSGGVSGATKGTLAVMVSCPRATYDTLQPILQVFGKLFFVGEKPGLAQTMKLANNLMAAAALAITSEAVVMGVKAGLDPNVMLDVINVSSGRNSASQDKFPRSVVTRTFDFGFATGLSYKDVRLCVDEAEAMGVPMVVGAAVRQMLAVTNATFGAGSDFTNMARVVEQWAGVEIDGRPKAAE
jgi:3-hydroxyisobutyrate dehydrogenase-like beta-hydroxyacid dehydrogenase